MKGSFRAAVVALALLAPVAAHATGNLKPGAANIITRVEVDAVECLFDTTIAVTTSTLDSLSMHCLCNRIRVESLTTGLTFAARVIGYDTPVRIFSSTKGSGFVRVDADLITFPSESTEKIGNTYATMQRILKGVIIDGLASGNIRVTGWSQ